MKVNIVMLAKDRPRLTLQAVDSLYSNTPFDLFNLTLIDDGSLLDVQNQVIHATIAGASNIAVLRLGSSKCITGQARNLGVYWAEKYWGRGDYLYLSDNDVYFTPEWLNKLVTCFGPAERDNKFKLMGGWNHPYLKPKPHKEGGAWLGSPAFDYGVIRYNEHDAVAGASQLMRWETWDKYGPLDAHAKGVGQSEDWAFCQKIIKDGGRVGSVYSRIVLNCGITNSFGEPSPGADIMLKELQEAKKQYPELYWE